MRDKIIAELFNGPVEVVFEKKDGTQRVMHCTLKEDLIPDVPSKKEGVGEPRTYSDTAIRVWDLDKSDWRAFRVDSVITYYAIP